MIIIGRYRARSTFFRCHTVVETYCVVASSRVATVQTSASHCRAEERDCAFLQGSSTVGAPLSDTPRRLIDREALPGDHTADGEKVEPHEAVCPLLEEEVREREAYSQRDQILLSRVRGRALRYPLLPYLSYVQLNSDATLEF